MSSYSNSPYNFDEHNNCNDQSKTRKKPVSMESSPSFQSVYHKILSLEHNIEKISIKGSGLLSVINEVQEHVKQFTTFLNEKLIYFENETLNLDMSIKSIMMEAIEVGSELEKVVKSEPSLQQLLAKIYVANTSNTEPNTRKQASDLNTREGDSVIKLEIEANNRCLLYTDVTPRHRRVDEHLDLSNLHNFFKSASSSDQENSSKAIKSDSVPCTTTSPCSNSDLDLGLILEKDNRSSTSKEPQINNKEKQSQLKLEKKTQYQSIFKRKLPKSRILSQIVDSDEEILNEDPVVETESSKKLTQLHGSARVITEPKYRSNLITKPIFDKRKRVTTTSTILNRRQDRSTSQQKLFVYLPMKQKKTNNRVQFSENMSLTQSEFTKEVNEVSERLQKVTSDLNSSQVSSEHKHDNDSSEVNQSQTILHQLSIPVNLALRKIKLECDYKSIKIEPDIDVDS